MNKFKFYIGKMFEGIAVLIALGIVTILVIFFYQNYIK